MSAHIAMVSEHASPLAALGSEDAGGQNVHVAMLSTALAARGHRVTVYTRRDDPSLPDRVALGPGVTVEHLAAGPATTLPKDDLFQHVPELQESLHAALINDPPDLVHAHFWMSGLAAVGAAAPLGLPVLQTFHALGSVKARQQGPADTSPPERIAAERWIVRHAAGVVATCHDEVAELAAMGVDTSHVDIVPCGVDVETFAPDGVTAPRTDRPRLLYVGRLVRRKGLGDVLVALQDLPGVELVAVGGPPAEAADADRVVVELHTEAERLAVDDRVQLAAQAPPREVAAWMRSADLVVCAPWYEPFGIVPLEAMACGVPVVGTAVGGLLDTVQDGRTGRLVPSRRPDLLAAAVRGLLADPVRRRRMGAAGRRRVLDRYRWSSVAAATEHSYVRHAGSAVTALDDRTDADPAVAGRR